MKNKLFIFLVSGLILLVSSCAPKQPLVVESEDLSETVETETVNQVEPITVPSTAHFRGIQAVNDNVIWLSGTAGTVLKTDNGGKKWSDVTVPNCADLDFRDVHAFDENRALVMSSGNGVNIYLTENGGETWTLQFEDTNPKVFLDGMDFSDEKNGIVYGDPISGVMDALITTDGGKNWNRIPAAKLPKTLEGEAGFAASGTGAVYKGNNIWLATGGGETCRIMKSKNGGSTWQVLDTRMKGGEGKGIFSMAFKDNMNGVVVGGDYVDSTSVHHNCAFTIDGGENWGIIHKNGPRGYRSCVAVTKDGTAIACGRTGIDQSSDFRVWTAVSDEGYFTCNAADEYIWFAGRSGRVARMKLP